MLRYVAAAGFTAADGGVGTWEIRQSQRDAGNSGGDGEPWAGEPRTELGRRLAEIRTRALVQGIELVSNEDILEGLGKGGCGQILWQRFDSAQNQCQSQFRPFCRGHRAGASRVRFLPSTPLPRLPQFMAAPNSELAFASHSGEPHPRSTIVIYIVLCLI